VSCASPLTVVCLCRVQVSIVLWLKPNLDLVRLKNTRSESLNRHQSLNEVTYLRKCFRSDPKNSVVRSFAVGVVEDLKQFFNITGVRERIANKVSNI